VTYNSESVIERFLESLDRVIRKLDVPIETILTDNASRDQTAELISRAEQRFPSLKIVKRLNKKNVGLSGALNEMIVISKGHSILVCNPDIEFTETIQEMVRISKLYPRFVLVPELFYPDGSLQRVMYRRFPTVLRILADFTSIGRSFPKLFDSVRKDYNYVNAKFKTPLDTVEQVAPVCMLIPEEVAKLFQPFYDPAFPVYWNDVDMSKRAEVLEIPRAIVPLARVIHGHGKSVKGMALERQFMLFYSSKGMIGYARRWGIHPNLLRLLFLSDAEFRTAKEIAARIIGRKTRILLREHKIPSFKERTRIHLLPFRCSLR